METQKERIPFPRRRSTGTYSPEASVEHQHGWVVPLEWEFVSEVREFERKPERQVRYDHEGEVGIIR